MCKRHPVDIRCRGILAFYNLWDGSAVRIGYALLGIRGIYLAVCRSLHCRVDAVGSERYDV